MKLIYILTISILYLYNVDAWYGCTKGYCWWHCGSSVERTFGAWCYYGKNEYKYCKQDKDCLEIGTHFDDIPCYSRCAAF